MAAVAVIIAGARSSLLSQAQVREVQQEINKLHPGIVFEPLFTETYGDKQRNISLRILGKTDFFTREIDELLLSGRCRIAIHSAKDLPEPIRKGIAIAAITKGLESSDSLVLRPGEAIDSLKHPVIATSSERREEAVRQIIPHAVFTDLRGTITERLKKLDSGEADGVVVAQAALIRLRLTHLNIIRLPGETMQYQGQLAVAVRSDDHEMRTLFACIDSRNH